VRQSL